MKNKRESDEARPGRWRDRFGRWLLGSVLGPVVVALLVALISAVSIALWEQYTGDSTPAATETRLFTPSTQERFEAVKKDRGTCNVDSNVNPSLETHRCFGETQQTGASPDAPRKVTYIYDPCWGYLQPELVCADNPWTSEVTIFRVGRWHYIRGGGKNRSWSGSAFPPRDIPDLFRPTPPLRLRRPWSLELSNGRKCVFASGASFTVAGERANYYCLDDVNRRSENPVGWVIGVPERKRPFWIARFLEDRGRHAEEVEVHVAWY